MPLNDYALIGVDKFENGLVSGTWIQNVCGSLSDAIKRAKSTSERNSNSSIAVVEWYGLKLVGYTCHDKTPLFATDRAIMPNPVYKCDGCGKSVSNGEYGTNLEHSIYCYACCGKNDLLEMELSGVTTLYLSGTPQGFGTFWNHKDLKLTNWPGSLEIKPMSVRVGRHNMARRRYDVWFTVPNDPYIWHGTQYGDNTQLCHCKRTKEKAKV